MRLVAMSTLHGSPMHRNGSRDCVAADHRKRDVMGHMPEANRASEPDRK
jgi:hypothetical protein